MQNLKINQPSLITTLRAITFLVILTIATGCGGLIRRSTTLPTITPSPTSESAQGTGQITITSPQNLPNPTLFPSPELINVDWLDRSVFISNLVPSVRDVLSERPDRTVYHIIVDIADDLRSISLKEELLYTNHENSPLDKVILRMYPPLFGAEVVFKEFHMNSAAIEPSISHLDSVLEFNLDELLTVGESLVISTEMDIFMPDDPSRNYQMFGVVADLLTLAHFYPMAAVFDETGWHTEIPPAYGDVIYADASYFIVQVDTLEGTQVISSGNTIEKVVKDGRQTVTIAGGPMRDFYLAVGSNLVANSEQVGDTLVTSYAPSSQNEGSLAALDTASSAITIFDGEIGPYSYSEFDILATCTTALGVEYPGMTAINQSLYLPVQGIDGTPNSIYLESTIAHEVGHQWFYSAVGNDQVNNPWMDEALTQYITGLYYTVRYGSQISSNYQSSWNSRWTRVKREQVPIGLPVSSYDLDYYGPIVYGRGPLFFKALKEKSGMQNLKHSCSLTIVRTCGRTLRLLRSRNPQR